MPNYGIVTYGSFLFDGIGGASIIGDIVVGPVPRTVSWVANALSRQPVAVADYVPEPGTIRFSAKLAGRETTLETAPAHLERMWHNLESEVARSTNSFVISVWGMASRSYRIVKGDRLESTITALTQSRAVMKFDVTLKYLP